MTAFSSLLLFSNELLTIYERWFNITEKVQMIITVQNPIDWASQVYKEAPAGLTDQQLHDYDDNPVIILKSYAKLMYNLQESGLIVFPDFQSKEHLGSE